MSTEVIGATSPVSRASYLKGCVFVVLAGAILSGGVFFVRTATVSNAWQYIFWRALGFTAALLVLAWLRDHRSPWSQLAGLKRMGWVAAGCMALSQVTFISSIKAATFAEVFLICSLAPIIAAALAWPLLKERLDWATAVAVVLGIAGVVVMTGGEFHAANVSGQLIALVSAIAFAGYTLATRGSRPQDLDAALIAVGILTAIAGATAMKFLDLPLLATPREALIAILHGAVVLSAGLFFYGQGSRYVSAVTFTLLAQAEAVLAPIWGYLFFAETPTRATLQGGALIVVAVVIQTWAGVAAPKPMSRA